MKLDFRQRLLATTLLVGASAVATPAFAQDTNPNTNPPDSSAVPTAPQTTSPVEGSAPPSTSATGETVKRSQDIIVTGSRIPQPNLESTSPVTVVSSTDVKVAGTSRTEDLINSLPQVFAAQGSNVSNGASGTATIDLRGLGSKRNLVLVNGKRLQAGDTGNPVADINFIPTQLIKRVDVLTGGASSVYGADAVAGVVNFILDTSFTGFRIDGQASVFNHKNNADAAGVLTANEVRHFLPPHGWSTNGGAQDIAAMFGAAFDDGRGHVTAYATYRTQDAILESTRDYSFCSLAARAARNTKAAADPAGTERDTNCGGSSTSNVTSVFLNGFGNSHHVEGNQLVKGTVPFNFAPYNYFQRPDERYTFGAFGDYEISPAFKPYVELMFMDDHSDAQIAPSGDFFNTNTINCDNPMLSTQQRNLVCRPATYVPSDAVVTFDAKGNPKFKSDFGNLVGQEPIFTYTTPGCEKIVPLPATCKLVGLAGFTPATTFLNGPNGGTFVKGIAYIGRRNVEGGGRDDDIRHTDYRIVAGMRGDVARGISYDAYYQSGHTLRQETYLNDFSVIGLNFALDAVSVDANGNIVSPNAPGSTIVCRGVALGEPAAAGCVPYNVFQTGGVTQNALNYLQTPGFQRGSITETIAHADFTINGDEYGWRLPWAETGIGLNLGAEYRKESLDFKVDKEFSSGDLAGQGGPTPPVAGSFDVRELFAEASIPIIEHNFIDEFKIGAGYRYSNYHVAGNSFNTDTYKIEADLAPIQDLRFRGSYNRAVRAPNIVELFFPTALGLTGSVDPCANGLETGVPLASAAQCAFSHVSSAQYGNIASNPAAQYQGLFGGNPNLQPEKADTWTAGVVLQPRFVPGLALTADYFNIKVKNIIGSLGFEQVLNGCMGFGGVPQDTTLCNFIQRGPNNQTLWAGTDAFILLRNLNQSGVGLATNGWDFNGNYSRRLGGLGTVNVAFVGTLLNKLENPHVGVNCVGQYGGVCGTPNPKWRHVLRVGLTMPNGLGISARWRHFSGVDAVEGTAAGPFEERLSAAEYYDLTFTARLAQRLNLRIGANNILDRQPPLAGALSSNGNTFPQVYDALGRYLFAGFTVDF
jgi:outer membrane receptor protein involved in Fe transport